MKQALVARGDQEAGFTHPFREICFTAERILHIVSESLELLEHVVDVVLVGGLVADDAAEEVWGVAERLVVHHQGASDHHLGLYASGDLERTNCEYITMAVCNSFS